MFKGENTVCKIMKKIKECLKMRAHVQKMKVWNELSKSENPVCFGGYLRDDSVRCFRACFWSAFYTTLR